MYDKWGKNEYSSITPDAHTNTNTKTKPEIGQALLGENDLNKVSTVRMREVMLDIQMMVPTGRPMGDGRGIRKLPFLESFWSCS